MLIFKNKICWVTGASSGIGKELCVQLAKLDAILVLSSRNIDNLNKVLIELKNKENHFILPLNLENSSEFNEKIELIVNKFGTIDFLFNNGGISQRAEAFETSEVVMRKIMETNYFGNVLLAKSVLNIFRKNNCGHFVVLSSISGKFGFYLRSSYCASKHALHGFYESLMLEEEKNNINVTIVCPGKINTPISVSALKSDGSNHGEYDDNQSSGMDVSVCVNKILVSVSKRKKEVLIGGKEIFAVYIKRFVPKLFWKIIKNQKAV